MIDFDAHYEALYGAMRAALDGDGLNDVPLVPVTSTDNQTNTPMAPPFVVYRQEVERPLGTQGGGNSKVLKSGWLITARAYDLTDSLDAVSAIASGLDEADESLTTTDGYGTTDIGINGVQSLYETEFKVYAVHLRVTWERSK